MKESGLETHSFLNGNCPSLLVLYPVLKTVLSPPHSLVRKQRAGSNLFHAMHQLRGHFQSTFGLYHLWTPKDIEQRPGFLLPSFLPFFQYSLHIPVNGQLCARGGRGWGWDRWTDVSSSPTLFTVPSYLQLLLSDSQIPICISFLICMFSSNLHILSQFIFSLPTIDYEHK